MSEWTITTGVWRTRRKTFSTVCDPQGNHVFSSRTFWPCVAYMDAIGVEVYAIRPDADHDPLAVPIRVDRRKDQTWQN